MAGMVKGEEFKTASERVYEVVSEHILSGKIAPGTRLSRREMAAMAGVSVIPATEAARMLERDGLVESRPHWGVRVVALSSERVRDMHNLREAVECQVARLLAQDVAPVQLEQLRALARELDESEHAPESDPGLVDELHHRFHMAMAGLTECASLRDALQRVNLYRLLRNAVSRRRKRSEPLPPDWHMRIVNAIATGNPDAAEAVMREHVQDSLKDVHEPL